MSYRLAKSLLLSLPWLLISGCENLPVRSEQAAGASAEATAAEVRPAPSRANAALLSDGVYSVLAGDIASQRGQYAEAYKQYLYAAHLHKDARLAELATKAALAARNEGGAADAVKVWLELAPDNLAAIQIAALLAAQQDDVDGAVKLLRHVVEIHQKQGEDGYMAVARMIVKIQDSSLRLKLMRALVDDEKSVQALFSLALVEAGSKNFAKAEQLCLQVLENQPDHQQARVLLVRSLASQDKQQQARAALESFLEDSPDDQGLRGVYARLLVEQDELDLARLEFRRLLEASPEDADTLFALGIIDLQQGRKDEAADYLRRLHKLGKHRNEAAYYLAQIHEEKGRVDEAMGWYAKVEGSNQFEARVRMAHIMASKGQVDQAREMVRQLRTHEPKDAPQLVLIESELLREVKRYAESIEVLDEGLEEFPGDHDLLYARALTSVNISRIDILERDLRQILSENPKHADALNALGYTLADQTDRHAEALGYIRQALALKPESAAILDSMGWVHYRLGDNETALRYLWRAMELLPDAEIAAHLGEVLWRQGEQARAKKIWREALAKEPDSDYLLKTMKRHGL